MKEATEKGINLPEKTRYGSAKGRTSYQQAEVQSARTFVLVGLLFYILGSVGWGILLVRTLLFGTLVSFGFGTVSLGVEPVLVDLGAFGFIVPGIFLGAAVGLTVWTWGMLQKIEQGRYQEAQASGFIQGILGLFFAFLIGGIFLIVAGGKLGGVVSPRPASPMMAAARRGGSLVRAVRIIGAAALIAGIVFFLISVVLFVDYATPGSLFNVSPSDPIGAVLWGGIPWASLLTVVGLGILFLSRYSASRWQRLS